MLPAQQEVPELLQHHLSLRSWAVGREITYRTAEATTISGVLGEVLTAIVTPFREDGSVDLDAFRALARPPRRQRLRRHRRRPARRARRRRSPTTSGSSSSRAAVDAVGDRGDRRRRHRHVLDRALGPPDRAGARARRRRVPRRDAVLQQAAAARDRRALRGGRGGDRPAGRLLRHPGRVVVDVEPETITRLAEIENVRAVKQAKPTSTRRATSSTCGLDLYAGDDDLVLPFLEVGGVGGICVHTHVVGPQVKELITRFRDGDVDARPRARRGAPAGDRAAQRADEPDRDQDGAQPARARGRRPAAAARRGRRGRDAPQIRDCLGAARPRSRPPR